MKDKVELATNTDNSFGIFYLPRNAVKKERLWNITWRIVFDASSSEGYSPSLNDVLEMHLNLLSEVLGSLLGFLGHPVSVIGDILWYRISKDDKGNRYTTHVVVNYR